MKNIKWTMLLFAALMMLFSCKTTKNGKVKTEELDEVTVKPKDIRDYQASVPLEMDLIHTRLEVSFDWEKQYLYGKANLTLVPYFAAQNQLTLDAKGMTINKVNLVENGGSTPLKYSYDSLQLKITLPKTYTRTDTFEVFIDYVAKPNELEAGGSAAITSDKGLYFINPLGKEPGKPKQIWTQGETEASSCWFPTIDKPNQKMTQEIYMTVPDSMVTLSNGLLLNSTKNANGTRTDYWKQSLPHAPYLVMMAVGKFTIIKDKWRNLPVEYYVEDKYVPYTQQIWGNTPQMLEYFSSVLGYAYPWEKYSQVAVYDYVSGAMENTTANLYFHELLRTEKELKDNNYETIIAHELFHQWFGDLLTTESWSNLTLNEGFADYSEYLWTDFKYGRMEADLVRYQSEGGYFGEAQYKQDPLIRFYYEDKEEMFDAHSYNKGGIVLNMLRDNLGDEAFFKSLAYYLKTHEFQAVEHANLRLAFEKVTGQDMNWFFNQWYLTAGHPVLDISYDYWDTTKTAVVTISQSASAEKGFVYRLPLKVDLYVNGKVINDSIVLDQKKQQFFFKVDARPQLINVDATKTLLAEKTDHKTLEEYVFQYKNAPRFMDKMEALEYFMEQQENPMVKDLLINAMNDTFWYFRQYVAENISLEGDDNYKSKLKASLVRLARQDKKTPVAASAIYKLGEFENRKEMVDYFKELAKENRSHIVVGAALEVLDSIAPLDAYSIAKEMYNTEPTLDVSAVVSTIYAEQAKPEDHQYFEDMAVQTTGYAKYIVLMNYGKYLSELADMNAIKKGMVTLKTFAQYAEPWWVRYAAARSIYTLAKDYEKKAKEKTPEAQSFEAFGKELMSEFQTIKTNEKDKNLINRYKKLE
ncbi:MAG: M1 family aminopeptidase [Chitinophagales bacterium]|nr:M1 family aminopeptidase [Chitinophagales bacterium]